MLYIVIYIYTSTRNEKETCHCKAIILRRERCNLDASIFSVTMCPTVVGPTVPTARSDLGSGDENLSQKSS